MHAYERLKERFRRSSAVSGAVAMLQWDRAAMMPEGGTDARAEQLAELEAVAHDLIVDPSVGDDLSRAADEDLSRDDRANLREMRHAWVHATAIPRDLVSALAHAASVCEMSWRRARADADFSRVLPDLRRLLSLVREEAAAKAAALDVSPYAALLDAYEPGGRSAAIDGVFADLEKFLPSFIDEVIEVQSGAPSPLPLPGPFSADRQRTFVPRIMSAMGFDFTYGRLDESVHPFCGGIADDVRLTTHYREDDLFSGLFGVIHETGHALYERGLPAEWRGQPAGEARGMSMHEGQSLTMEMQAARSRAFLSWLAPQLQKLFGGDSRAWSVENVVATARKVRRDFIRIDADEVTYPAHVILRYRLEKAMLSGDLLPDDLPGAWNDGMQQLLGIVPPDDTRGCPQDIHWYDGDWGYFPTYTLGAMTAAQLFATARSETPGLEEALSRGDFSPLVGWMREHVHKWGSLVETPDMLRRATGRELSAEAFKAHLKARYVEGA